MCRPADVLAALAACRSRCAAPGDVRAANLSLTRTRGGRPAAGARWSVRPPAESDSDAVALARMRSPWPGCGHVTRMLSPRALDNFSRFWLLPTRVFRFHSFSGPYICSWPRGPPPPRLCLCLCAAISASAGPRVPGPATRPATARGMGAHSSFTSPPGLPPPPSSFICPHSVAQRPDRPSSPLTHSPLIRSLAFPSPSPSPLSI